MAVGCDVLYNNIRTPPDHPSPHVYCIQSTIRLHVYTNDATIELASYAAGQPEADPAEKENHEKDTYLI